MVRVLATLLCGGAAAVLGWALLTLPDSPAGLTQESLTRLPQSGVTNPVTAVLLNYRGYDTLLEVGVLLLAIVGVWSLRRADSYGLEAIDRPLLSSLLGIGLPLVLLSGGYLLWVGAFAPGGAFQGGALIGGGAVLALLGSVVRPGHRGAGWLRLGLAVGLVVFAGVAAGLLAANGQLLGYATATAGAWILVIESAVLVSIGLTLGALFLGGRTDEPDGRPTRRKES